MSMSKLVDFPLIRQGSAKDILRVDRTSIGFRFLGTYSVFDVGRAPDIIPGKAEAMCKSAVTSFKIAKKAGLLTHFIEQLDPVTIRVREAQIITDRCCTPLDENYVLPAELIYRLRVAGSIERDFRSGKKKPEKYGLPPGVIPEPGSLFPKLVRHPTTKFEKIDRDLDTNEEICRMAGITPQDLEEYWQMVEAMVTAARPVLKRAGYDLLDGKAEMLVGPKRKKMFGDVFITPDEDRPFPLYEYEIEGKIEHFGKEFLRQIHIESGYYDELQVARKAGLPDPPIPRLTEEQLIEVSRRYSAFSDDYELAA
ncbi:MAG TPA: phosphoribosylaminoimidazolesuccinocarboxamide synthase [Candidatus Bathyarchaeia archaeon]|nr:phosphoribosylaminoimidazolesuccinocarboxamide synthase [Candidatus Bathyarchaeia archaeon]